MVYNGYAIPLLMQTEQSSTQICTNPNADINNGRNTTTVAINYHQVPQTSSSQSTINHDQTNQQQSHHLIGGGGNNEEGQTFSSSNYQSPNGKLKPQFKCDQCHMNFGSKSAHTSHMKSHAKQFQTQNNMVVTANVVVPMQNGMSSGGMNVQPPAAANTNTTEPYQCDVCKKTFAVPARLVRHYRTHTGERPFACEFCHKTFSVKENLQVHRRIHTKERPYKCDVCGRAFEHSGKLHRHMRIHTGERPHKCSVCGKTFIQSGQLVIHMRTHTGEKPYKCPVEGCGKGFTCSKQLKVHSRTHTGEKPYHCDICFRDFGYNHVLKLHRVQHYGSKCYKCTICDETFKSKKDMEAHIKGHANDMPDDEDEQNDEQMVIIADNKHQQQRDSKSPMHIKHDEPIPLVTSPASTTNQMCITPKDSGSEANSDGDETNYYNMYSRFNSTNGNYHTQSGVNPALLAAASIAAAASAAGFDDQQRSVSTSPPASHMNISSNSNGSSNGSSAITIHAMQPPQNTPPQPTNSNFIYEPMVLMRQNGYFGQNSQSPEFKPSLVSANLVRHVEEAIAIAEPLLTPPRSSPESPDRSSSPESDSILMADRDIMSLPPRKRKLYLKDNQTTSDSSTAMRISSVIQFAKAS